MKSDVQLEFIENGIQYVAGKGFAYAEKDGKKIWSAMDVFRTTAPTKELVLTLDNLCTKAYEDYKNEESQDTTE